jgi:hypothetical protein
MHRLLRTLGREAQPRRSYVLEIPPLPSIEVKTNFSPSSKIQKAKDDSSSEEEVSTIREESGGGNRTSLLKPIRHIKSDRGMVNHVLFKQGPHLICIEA